MDAQTEGEHDGSHDLAASFCDPAVEARIVTLVRDPVGQAISAYFQFAQARWERRQERLELTADAFLRWCDRWLVGDYSTIWFDRNLRDVFGFDFRACPFDRERRSIRYEGRRVSVLCLRVEDPTERKETELRWLAQNEDVRLERLNETARKERGEKYLKMLASFVAPPRLLDELYTSAVTRHFYTPSEIETLRTRWSASRTS